MLFSRWESMCLMRASSGYPTGKPSWQRGQLRMSEPTVSISSCGEKRESLMDPSPHPWSPNPSLPFPRIQGREGYSMLKGSGYPFPSNPPTSSASLPLSKGTGSPGGVYDSHCSACQGTCSNEESQHPDRPLGRLRHSFWITQSNGNPKQCSAPK